MLIQIILFLILGIFSGTITGLIPGIHINLVGLLIVSLIISTTIFSSINPIYFIIFIVAMAITHTFVDFIPSIFLGCPDTDTELSILPGHELLKDGKGYEAVILTAYGSLAAVFILIPLSLPSIFIISKIYYLTKELIPYLLIIVSIMLIFSERKKLSAFFVFLISGILGLIVLNFPPNYLSQPLLPLLTGLFGSSMLLLSIKNKIKIPKQEIKKINVKKKLLKPITGSLIASPLCSFLPGLGSGQAAIIGNMISKTNKKGFLILIGATNTFVMGFSFIFLYTISKTRTGAAVALKQIIGVLSWKIFILILIIILISGIISFLITHLLAKFFSKNINKIKYEFISIITLFILLIIVFFVSGFMGVIVLVISTFTGIYSISLNVRRTNMMGCLLIPTIILYLF